jgi:hypothetical protein
MSIVDKWYPIDLHGHRENQSAGVTVVLSSSDMPVEFSVDVAGDLLRIQMRYPYETREPTQTVRMDRVDFTVGQHSRRLFALAINVEGMGIRSQRELADKLRSALWRAFETLRERTQWGGPRLNYMAASEGLGIDPAEAETPAWMAEAVERMRLEQSGSHSR